MLSGFGTPSSADDYMRLVDNVFPRPKFSEPKRFVVVLRYLPSFHPEVQIVLSYDLLSNGEAEYKTLRAPLREFFERHKDTRNVGGAEALPVVESCRIPISGDQMRRWFFELLDRIGSSAITVGRQAMELDGSKVVRVQLDGTRYCIDMEMGGDRLSLAVQGSEIGACCASKDADLVRWMDTVRRRVYESVKRSPQTNGDKFR